MKICTNLGAKDEKWRNKQSIKISGKNMETFLIDFVVHERHWLQ